MTLDSQMAQKSLPKIFLKKSYCTCGAFKSKKPQKSSKKSVFNGISRPFCRSRRVDNESLNSHDISQSDGSKKFTKNLLKKISYRTCGAFKSKKPPKSSKKNFNGISGPLCRRRRVDNESLNSHDIRQSDGSKSSPKIFSKNLIALAVLLRVKNL